MTRFRERHENAHCSNLPRRMPEQLQVPQAHDPCAIMTQFRLPRVYKTKGPQGQPTRLIVFGFPISRNYLLEFADAHNLLPNSQSDEQRRRAAYIHMRIVAEERFDAQIVDVLDINDGSGNNALFSVAVASNRSKRHMSRMRTYRHLEKLADFLRLDPEAAEWAYADLNDAVDMIRAGNRII
ncbi:unnamed protein product [Cyclocybe aegerita]|uniref:Uncharacterized protein n=1 Tax=Cyclocybe aegerita TaxID=1973307 RepID=A0A8S0VQ23_CYCAE|nr:unnamed protein product [Cyclocybe aegerita]